MKLDWKGRTLAGAISTIEREFLADVILPDGRTILEHIADQRPALEAGGSIRLLPSGDGRRKASP